ncbi:hypothetical protein [Azospirillum sp. B506]|uniref:hypothetical protein n=1 Tax=Azospirillum sp. B506 TaxID=137721 RepID=UPI00131F0414|nr:hypothetical protein [Azospirillum sp. B506]
MANAVGTSEFFSLTSLLSSGDWGAMTFHPDTLCPFCGLGCGDIGIDRDESGIAPRPTVCPQADRLFRRSTPVPMDARGSGTAISTEDAIAEVDRLLHSSRASLIAGLAAEADGVLAALSLAKRIGATVGRNRCNIALVVGPDRAMAFPRMWERWVVPTAALVPGGARNVIFLGGKPPPEAVQCLGGRIEANGLNAAPARTLPLCLADCERHWRAGQRTAAGSAAGHGTRWLRRRRHARLAVPSPAAPCPGGNRKLVRARRHHPRPSVHRRPCGRRAW